MTVCNSDEETFYQRNRGRILNRAKKNIKMIKKN